MSETSVSPVSVAKPNKHMEGNEYMKIGIIGVGHLGKAFIAGLVRSGIAQDRIILNARTMETLDAVKQIYPCINVTTDKKELVAESDIIVIVVKSQNAEGVLTEIGEIDLSGKTIISFMAGISLSDMREMLRDTRREYRLIRMMPNLGISLCKGIIGVCCENDPAETEEVLNLFRQLGYLIHLPEEKLESITICAASGLAFAAYLMKEYRNSCDRLINDAVVSEEVTTHIFENVIEIVRNEGKTFESLIEQISTKGGTTEAGISKLQDSNLSEIINQCIDTAYDRVNALKEK